MNEILFQIAKTDNQFLYVSRITNLLVIIESYSMSI